MLCPEFILSAGRTGVVQVVEHPYEGVAHLRAVIAEAAPQPSKHSHPNRSLSSRIERSAAEDENVPLRFLRFDQLTVDQSEQSVLALACNVYRRSSPIEQRLRRDGDPPSRVGSEVTGRQFVFSAVRTDDPSRGAYSVQCPQERRRFLARFAVLAKHLRCGR